MKWHQAFMNIYNRTRYLKYLIDITYMCMFLKCCNGIFKWYLMNLLSHAHCQTPRKSHSWFCYSKLFKRVRNKYWFVHQLWHLISASPVCFGCRNPVFHLFLYFLPGPKRLDGLYINKINENRHRNYLFWSVFDNI